MTDPQAQFIFANVVASGGFSAAAERLQVPKSNVSRAVARLEHRLGVRLLERTTRRIRLTDIGELYLLHVQRAIEESEQADQLVQLAQAAPRGRLRVGLPVTFARAFLAPALPTFLSRYPEVRLQLQIRAGFVDPIATGLDLIIQTGKPSGDSQLIVRHLGKLEQGIFASPAYIRKHGKPASPSNLTGHACVTLSDRGPGTMWRLSKQTSVEEVRLEPRLVVGDPVIHRELAVAGAVVALIPDFMVREELRKGRLIRILPDWSPESLELHALYPSRASLTPKLRVFLEFVEEQLRAVIRTRR